MKKNSFGYFARKLVSKKEHYPWSGQLELTYRCNLDCIHCYCKGSEGAGDSSLRLAGSAQNDAGLCISQDKELTTAEWKRILDVIQKEGCIWLTFTGGDPLVRDDFLELYSYAKSKGFIITLFTNGYGFKEKIIDYLTESPPYAIEITLNGVTKQTYEAITQIEGSFEKVIQVIKVLAKTEIRLILKSNCLRQNKDEIGRIKAFTDGLLGKPHEMAARPVGYSNFIQRGKPISRGKGNKRWRFKYDPMIYARLNGDTTPCNYRLSFEELLEVKHSDPEIWEEYKRGLCGKFPDLGRDKEFLYRCNAWLTQFFINPYGRLKFCQFSDKFSIDLKTIPFRKGFYNVFSQVLNERFKTKSKCRYCDLRPICYYCPARAYLETGNEEAPVEYYCHLAEESKRQREALNC